MAGRTILFGTPFSLLDRSSGAAISCNTLLRQLMARGNKVVSVGATIFDKPAFDKPGDWLADKKAELTKLDEQLKIFRFEEAGMVHYVVPARHQKRPMMLAHEEEAWWALFRKAVDDVKPDIVFGFGGQTTEQLAWRWLRHKGIPSIFYLVNAGYLACDWFDQMGAIVTDTEATAGLYRETLGISPHIIGKYIEPVPALPNAPRDHILLINPAPEKGVSLFLALAEKMALTHPDQRFLVVESRAQLAPAMRAHGITRLPNVALLPLQSDMTPVWNRTKILLLPSLWHESGSRSVVEAMSLGIPVLASASGGMAEMLNGSGRLFEMPKRDRKDYLAPIEEPFVQPWLDEIHRLLGDPAYFARESAKASAAWASHPKVNRLELFDAAIEDAIASTPRVTA